MTDLSRRKFLQWLGLTGAGALLTITGCAPVDEPDGQTTSAPPQPTEADVQANTPVPQPTAEDTPKDSVPEPQESEDTPVPVSSEPAYLAVMHGADPAVITRAAVDALGGMERFVQPGNDVIVKPNICVNHNSFEYASTTNPTVVATLVSMALDAGAKRVRVMDTPYTNGPETAYRNSGISDAVTQAGGEMEIMSGIKFAKFDLPGGIDLKNWSVYRDVVDADVLINVPIAKHHGSTRLTLGAKNLMGVIGNPNQFHLNLHQRIADLNTLLRPALTVVDAVRILTANGPGGGNLEDVKKLDTVIASHDIVTADAYATSLFDLTPDDIGYIRLCHEMGLGEKNWQGVAIDERTL